MRICKEVAAKFGHEKAVAETSEKSSATNRTSPIGADAGRSMSSMGIFQQLTQTLRAPCAAHALIAFHRHVTVLLFRHEKRVEKKRNPVT